MAKRTARRGQPPQPSDAGMHQQGTSDDRVPVAVIEEDVRAEVREPEPDAIARRAYEIYCERGYQDGRDMDDWLQAENELRIAK